MESSAIVARLFRPSVTPPARPTTAGGALEVRLRPLAPRRLGGEALGGGVAEETVAAEHAESAPTGRTVAPHMEAGLTVGDPAPVGERPAFPPVSSSTRSESEPLAEPPAAPTTLTTPTAKPQPPERPLDAQAESPVSAEPMSRPPDVLAPTVPPKELEEATQPRRPEAPPEIERQPPAASPPIVLRAEAPTPTKSDAPPEPEVARTLRVESGAPAPSRANEKPDSSAAAGLERAPEAVRPPVQPDSEPSEVSFRVERVERVFRDERESEALVEPAPEPQPSPEREPPLVVEARPIALGGADRSGLAAPPAPQPGTVAGGVTVSIGRIEIVARRPAAARRQATRPRSHRIDPGAAFRRKE